MHDLISRDIRTFIRDHGRYRFGKLYELIQKNESLDNISDLLEIDKESILHWKTIFEMLGSDGMPSFVSQEAPGRPQEAFLGASWAILGPSWRRLGPS